MDRKRIMFLESLKKACGPQKVNINRNTKSSPRKTESPLPPSANYTNEEMLYWAGVVTSDTEDTEVLVNTSTEFPLCQSTIPQRKTPTYIAESSDEELESSKTIVTTAIVNTKHHEPQNFMEVNQDVTFDNTVISTIVNAEHHELQDLMEVNQEVAMNCNYDQILSSNNGLDSNQAGALNGNYDPILSSFNGPDSCIVPLLDITRVDNISVAPSPFNESIASIYPSSVQSAHVNDKRKRKNNPDKIKTQGKGRKMHKDEWIDVKRKVNRNFGKEYVSRNGVKRPARKIGSFCNRCKFNCPKKYTNQDREKIFKAFWELGDNTRQWDFLSKYCERIHKRRQTTELQSRRKYTVKYSLPHTSNDSSGVVPVCRTMFLNTLGIGVGMVATTLRKIEAGNGIIHPDCRGGSINHKIIIDDEMIKSVKDHVLSFQPVESHYVRSRTSKLYLDESLSYSRMYLLYKEWVTDNTLMYRNPAQTLRQYRDIVNNCFNLGFYSPRKDQCDVCHVYKNSAKPVSEIEYKTYNDHIRNKEIARELKAKYKELSVKDPETTLTAAYDFQKIHGIPHGQASILYYKRKLSVYNLTFYSLGQKEGTCYVWDETIAKKGATEVATCVYLYVKEHSQKGIQFFNFLSDNCGGQNRNRIVFLSYLHAAKDFNVTIRHTYLERGHTQNEGDSVQALIERFAKNKVIYIPDDWYNMIRWAKTDGKPYIVIEMKTSEFLDFKKLLSGPNWVTNTNGEKIFWSKIRQIQIFPNETDRIYYKTDFCNHEYDCIILYRQPNTRTRRGRKDTHANGDNVMSLTMAYLEKFSIPINKFHDLKYLCEHQIIPKKYHNFYQSLVYDDVEAEHDSLEN